MLKDRRKKNKKKTEGENEHSVIFFCTHAVSNSLTKPKDDDDEVY